MFFKNCLKLLNYIFVKKKNASSYIKANYSLTVWRLESDHWVQSKFLPLGQVIYFLYNVISVPIKWVL